MDAQRRAITKELESEHSRLGSTLDDARKAIADARTAANSIAGSANDTARTVRHDSEELVTVTTRALLWLILAASLIPMCAMLLYRYITRRWLAKSN